MRFETPKRATRTPKGLKIDGGLDFHESATWFAIVDWIVLKKSLGGGLGEGPWCLRRISVLGFPEFGKVICDVLPQENIINALMGALFEFVPISFKESFRFALLKGQVSPKSFQDSPIRASRHPNKRAARTSQGLKVDDVFDFHGSVTCFAIVGL